MLLRSLRDVLESDGHVVPPPGGAQPASTHSGRACDKGKCFDAVITDLGMPDIDGRRVASRDQEPRRRRRSSC